MKIIRLIVLTVSFFLATCTFGCGPSKLELLQQENDHAYSSGQISISKYLNRTSQLEFQREKNYFGISPDKLNYSIQQRYQKQLSPLGNSDIMEIHH